MCDSNNLKQRFKWTLDRLKVWFLFHVAPKYMESCFCDKIKISCQKRELGEENSCIFLNKLFGNHYWRAHWVRNRCLTEQDSLLDRKKEEILKQMRDSARTVLLQKLLKVPVWILSHFQEESRQESLFRVVSPVLTPGSRIGKIDCSMFSGDIEL